MITHFTLNGFLRRAANGHLAKYFRDNEVDLALDIEALKPRNNDPIIQAVDRLPDEQRGMLERDFGQVALLGNQAGVKQIRDEARYRELDLDAVLRREKSQVNMAFWTYLYQPQVFEAALRFAVPHLAGRYWKRRLPVASAPDVDLTEKVGALEAAVSRYFREVEGRGKACKVEHLLRRPLQLFHAFPEDFPTAPLAWVQNRLEPHPYRPAFEVVFVYEEVAGTLDVYFEGERATVERLWKLFAEVVLGIEKLPEREQPAFVLEELKSQDFAFVRPAGSAIEDVRLKQLTLATLTRPSAIISVDADATNNPNAVHEMLDQLFSKEPTPGRISLSQCRVIGTKVQVRIDPRDGTRSRTRTFELTGKTARLKHDGIDLELRQMLIESGIDLTHGKHDAGTGSTAQHAAE